MTHDPLFTLFPLNLFYFIRFLCAGTIFKQMKILQFGGGFTERELKAYRYVVFSNCISQMKVLVSAAARLGIPLSDENQEKAEQLSGLPTGGDNWTREVGEFIKALWEDSGIKETYEQRDTAFQLNDSAAYFFENIDRFLEEDYLPTNTDILYARVRSTGIEEAEFRVEDLEFRMLDVGGQRSERRKWIHCFDKVSAVLFVAALSEYDQVLREDDSQNRMKESLLLFDEICNSPWFRATPFILFLNKKDLFEKKIARVDLKTCFPDYKGAQDYEEASKFIEKKFREVDQEQNTHQIYVHRTCAVDTQNVKHVWKDVSESLLLKVIDNIF
eukprot:TRINITY_DN5238_c0_g1_i3.p1 TRINITY_DN5238_c0_g1~~TRINITY_DN5238_c0_g1_i3.p1  ORF type:complete len:329 (+),score=124.99 TRINITY_DN5238_c0_g1_i3:247-1233(+)